MELNQTIYKMETPDNEAGQMTEEIMWIVRQIVPEIKMPDQYNKLYGKIYQYLQKFPKLQSTTAP